MSKYEDENQEYDWSLQSVKPQWGGGHVYMLLARQGADMFFVEAIRIGYQVAVYNIFRSGSSRRMRSDSAVTKYLRTSAIAIIKGLPLPVDP